MRTKFGKNLKELRIQQKLSQEELGRKLGVTQRKISYWESGSVEPDLVTLCKIGDFFDVSIDMLLGRREY